ncbi:hypothetical protein JTE90_008758 [Oedothorax gibbosus]|uniref:Uncharacterized protein n=1 Tax=Oedothorax gibbosus TaxID=931172 RepID=A0AAV6UPN2_9ARAC|nr:hypothetical protein JTE90_008758 [Oedothorax gibbosus]
MKLLSLFCFVVSHWCYGYPIKGVPVFRTLNTSTSIDQQHNNNEWELKIGLDVEEIPEIKLRAQISIVDTPQLWFFVGICIVGMAGFILHLVLRACKMTTKSASCKTG